MLGLIHRPAWSCPRVYSRARVLAHAVWIAGHHRSGDESGAGRDCSGLRHSRSWGALCCWHLAWRRCRRPANNDRRFLRPVVFDYLTRRRESAAAARTRLERVSVKAASPSSLSRFGPAALLRPDRQVVGFIDRPELGRLREWCTDAEEPQVLLLTGAGGVGKTRLSLQLAQDLNGLGWKCAVRPGEEGDAVPAVGAVHSGQVLLVVDYAETRTELVAMLRAVAEAEDGQLKVLMLARSGGEWWEQLEASADATVRSVARAAARVYLPPFSAEAARVSDIFHGAVAAFADALGVAEPDEVEVDAPGGPLPILVLHAAALLAVLDLRDRSQQAPTRVVADARVLDELLARERAFWLGAAQAANLTGAEGIDSGLAAQSVTVACLSPPRMRQLARSCCCASPAWQTAHPASAGKSPGGCGSSTHRSGHRIPRRRQDGGGPCCLTWWPSGSLPASSRRMTTWPPLACVVSIRIKRIGC